MNKNNKNIDLYSFFNRLKDKKNISGQVLAKALNLLASHEVKLGGPYFDYSKSEKKVVNLRANQEIARVLNLFDVVLKPLSNYLRSQKVVLKNNKTSNTRQISLSEKKALKGVEVAAKERFANLKDDLKDFVWQEISKTLKGNTDRQMALMPYYFQTALGKKGKRIPDKLIAEMGLANIFFWTSFIIYDNFWDEDEEVNPAVLPTANLYAQSFTSFFVLLFPKDKGFHKFVEELMDGLYAANTWEITHRRTTINGNKLTIPNKFPSYGDYTRAYQPASAHILGPVVIMKFLGYSEKSKETKGVIDYFKNYLIAMQFNDDLHDWKEDLERGHLSSSTIPLFQAFKSESPKAKEINIKKDIKKLQEIFWFKVIPKICKKGIKFTNKSRQALNKLKFIEDFTPLEKFILLPENALKEAMREYKTGQELLKEY